MASIASGARSPLEEYRHRLGALQAEQSRFTRRSNFFAVSKIAVLVVTLLVGIWLAKYFPSYIFALVIPVAFLVVLFILHERILQALRRSARLKAFYERGLARLEDRWAGTGQPGERFLDSAHLYARDLDLFGRGSMFELLSTARTRAGEETLAAWLLAPAPIEEILARQTALKELHPLLDFREQMALAGEDITTGLQPESLVAWSENNAGSPPSALHRKFSRIIAPLLVGLWVLSLLAWGFWEWGMAALLMSLVNLMATYWTRAQVDKGAEEIEAAMHGLDRLAAIFRRIEGQHFSTERLAALQAILNSQKEPASTAILKLHRRVTWLESNENLFVKFADLFIFWTAQWVAAVQAWRDQYGAAMRGWLAVAGEIEALNSLASYAYEHPDDTFPQFVESGPYLSAESFSHPLIPRDRAVANDLKLDANLQMLVISGPNMAGKSTFIRSVGVNVVLAQAGAPVRARKMVLSKLAVTASICVLDSLQGGLSRFYAEIMRLKQIDEKSRGSVPVLFLLDELLSGTNSHDRRIGTESFVRTLLRRGAIGLVTTHDLALAEIADGMGEKAANFHFQDSFENGELRFDYRLSPGVVSTTNALKLMRSVGLDV